jgi:hypothetical protein
MFIVFTPVLGDFQALAGHTRPSFGDPQECACGIAGEPCYNAAEQLCNNGGSDVPPDNGGNQMRMDPGSKSKPTPRDVSSGRGSAPVDVPGALLIAVLSLWMYYRFSSL